VGDAAHQGHRVYRETKPAASNFVSRALV